MSDPDTKRCPKCENTLSRDQFGKNVRRHDGLNSYCLACARIYTNERYARNPEPILKATREYKERNSERVHARERARYYRDRDNISARAQARRRVNRKLVIEGYGGACTCCGETQVPFLTVDHVNDDGNEHRKELPQVKLYVWLIKNGFPEGFQILCANCNMAKATEGMCPHQGVIPGFIPRRRPRVQP